MRGFPSAKLLHKEDSGGPLGLCVFQGWLAAGTEATGGGGRLVSSSADFTVHSRSVLLVCAAANHQPRST